MQKDETVQATLLNATEGYAITDDRIFYTTTLGRNWTDITPKEANGDLMTTTFVSPTEGIAYFSSAKDGSGAASVDVFHTSDRGVSWSRLSSLSEGQALSHFGGQLNSFFLDEQHGWLVALQSSSTAFSFRTYSALRTVGRAGA
ncbi:hypothetical protein [Granulicella sp. S190]|uniref:hypothetical protein n=1 Tax=Granulicella sp. S190 TaxID=1747226 RepID=UPI00131D7B17|nr:hypothetical protein [Granulicella sp. S190]